MVPPQIEQIVRKVDTFIAKYPHITQYERLKGLEEKTGQPKAYFFVAFCFLFMGFLSLIGGVKLIVDLLGFVYPAYMSFKSMDANSEDETQWLTYWVVFSFLNIYETIFSWFVYYIPFYYYFKIGAIVWMYYPATRGAQSIYESVLRPIFLPYLEMAEKNSNKKVE